MNLFDFHHHKINNKNGILNLNLDEIPPNETPFSIAIHPYFIKENWHSDFEKVKELAKNPNCIAIGECGLDAMINIPQSLQEEVFKQHISLSNELKKPLIIHCVRRFQEVIKLCKPAQTPKIIHGFNKKIELAEDLLKHGFYLSFGKNVLQNVSLQSVIQKIPLERLFLETDDKDFDISELYIKVSELKNTDVKSLEGQILENLRTIFNDNKLAGTS